MSRKANLLAAARRRGAEPSMAQLRAQIMAGEHRVAPKAVAKPAAALPKLHATLPAALPAAVEAERGRIEALHGLAAQAQRMGLAFDLTAAVASGTPVSKIRSALLDDAVDKSDAAGEIGAYAAQSPHGTNGHGALSDKAKRAAFAKGLKQSGGLR